MNYKILEGTIIRNYRWHRAGSVFSCLMPLFITSCNPDAYEKGIPKETVIMNDQASAEALRALSATQIRELMSLPQVVATLKAANKELEREVARLENQILHLENDFYAP